MQTSLPSVPLIHMKSSLQRCDSNGVSPRDALHRQSNPHPTLYAQLYRRLDLFHTGIRTGRHSRTSSSRHDSDIISEKSTIRLSLQVYEHTTSIRRTPTDYCQVYNTFFPEGPRPLQGSP